MTKLYSPSTLLPIGMQPFRPRSVFLNTPAGLFTEISDSTALSTTNFLFPNKYMYGEGVINTTRLNSGMSDGAVSVITIPDLYQYAVRIDMRKALLNKDVASFNWFIKLFKYLVFPQIKMVDELYGKHTTQHTLLSGLKTYFTDPTLLDDKTALYRAVLYPSPIQPRKLNLAFTHAEFAEWMYQAMLHNIPMALLVKTSEVMFGKPIC